MGISKLKASENRSKILASAARLFRERGVEGVGLIELMRDAGFSQGGFYNHFRSKDHLVAEVVAGELVGGGEVLVEQIEAETSAGESPLKRQIETYLSEVHFADVEHGCPIAGFVTDVSRSSVDTQSHFSDGLDDAFTILGALIAKSGVQSSAHSLREQAMALYSSLVGTLLLARAIGKANPQAAADLLEVNRRQIWATFEAQLSKPRR